jgi:hypothetical protein
LRTLPSIRADNESRMDTMSDPKIAGASRVEDWAARHGISRAQAYKEIAAGRLIARKVGTRTIITDEDGDDWRRALPKMQSQQIPA